VIVSGCVRRPDRLDDEEREQQDIAEMEWRRRRIAPEGRNHCPEAGLLCRESVGQRSSMPVDVEMAARAMWSQGRSRSPGSAGQTPTTRYPDHEKSTRATPSTSAPLG